jgi:protein SCO1/2
MRLAMLLPLGVALLLAGCGRAAGVPQTGLLPVYDSVGLTPHWLDAAQLRDTPGRFPEFHLQDQSGNTLSRADLDGRIVVADFFLSGCSSLCPKLRSSMAAVRDAFAADSSLLLLSHTVVPEADTVPLLAAYARSNGIDGRRWRLLTGPRSVIEQLEFGAYLIPRPHSDQGTALHSELFVLLDRRQRVRGVYNATLQTEMNFLIGDIRALQAEEPG